MKNHLIKIARLRIQERELERRAKALRDKIVKANGAGRGYYNSIGFFDDGTLIFDVDPILYLQVEPPGGERPKPVVEEFRFEGQEPYARLKYPPIWVGEYAPGKNLWVQSWSGKFDIPTSPAPSPLNGERAGVRCENLHLTV